MKRRFLIVSIVSGLILLFTYKGYYYLNDSETVKWVSTIPSYLKCSPSMNYEESKKISSLVSTAPPSGIPEIERAIVLNLARREDRKTRMMKLLSFLDIGVQFLNATDSKDLQLLETAEETSLNVSEQIRISGLSSLGAVGCWQSHVRAHKIAANIKGRTLILEDDIDLAMSLKNRLPSLIRDANLYTPEWGYLFLGHSKSLPEHILNYEERLISNNSGLFRLGWKHSTTEAYVINGPIVAKRMLQLIDAPFLKPFIPFDDLIRFCKYMHLRLIAWPYLAVQVQSAGDISTSKNKQKLPHLKDSAAGFIGLKPVFEFPYKSKLLFITATILMIIALTLYFRKYKRMEPNKGT